MSARWTRETFSLVCEVLFEADGMPDRDKATDVLAALADAGVLVEPGRLAAAEQVCILFGWTGVSDRSERGDAVTQAWMEWKHQYGAEHRAKADDPEWEQRITELARRRRAIREATLARIHGEVPDGQ